ncbi:MAG: hypothetical protein WAM97_07460 [Acidimicrobiales bacterium]
MRKVLSVLGRAAVGLALGAVLFRSARKALGLTPSVDSSGPAARSFGGSADTWPPVMKAPGAKTDRTDRNT